MNVIPSASSVSTAYLQDQSKKTAVMVPVIRLGPAINIDLSETRILKHFLSPRTAGEELAHAELKEAILRLQEFERDLSDHEKMIDEKTALKR